MTRKKVRTPSKKTIERSRRDEAISRRQNERFFGKFSLDYERKIGSRTVSGGEAMRLTESWLEKWKNKNCAGRHGNDL